MPIDLSKSLPYMSLDFIVHANSMVQCVQSSTHHSTTQTMTRFNYLKLKDNNQIIRDFISDFFQELFAGH